MITECKTDSGNFDSADIFRYMIIRDNHGIVPASVLLSTIRQLVAAYLDNWHDEKYREGLSELVDSIYTHTIFNHDRDSDEEFTISEIHEMTDLLAQLSISTGPDGVPFPLSQSKHARYVTLWSPNTLRRLLVQENWESILLSNDFSKYLLPMEPRMYAEYYQVFREYSEKKDSLELYSSLAASGYIVDDFARMTSLTKSRGAALETRVAMLIGWINAVSGVYYPDVEGQGMNNPAFTKESYAVVKDTLTELHDLLVPSPEECPYDKNRVSDTFFALAYSIAGSKYAPIDMSIVSMATDVNDLASRIWGEHIKEEILVEGVAAIYARKIIEIYNTGKYRVCPDTLQISSFAPDVQNMDLRSDPETFQWLWDTVMSTWEAPGMERAQAYLRGIRPKDFAKDRIPPSLTLPSGDVQDAVYRQLALLVDKATTRELVESIVSRNVLFGYSPVGELFSDSVLCGVWDVVNDKVYVGMKWSAASIEVIRGIMIHRNIYEQYVLLGRIST